MAATPDPGPLHRLVRTLSGRSSENLSPTIVASPTAPNTPATPLQPVPLQRTVSATSSQKRRLSVGDRLRKLGKDVARLANFASPSSKAPAPDPVIDASVATAQPRHAKLLSMVAEGDEPTAEAESGSATPGLDGEDLEPDTLAERLQHLIDDLPFPAPGDRRGRPVIKPAKPPARDKSGRPIPPANSTPIKDSKLIKLLSSATIMNGSKDGSRPSIWSILEKIGAPPHAYPPVEGEQSPPGNDHETHGDDGEPDVFSDNSSVMLYSPLVPGKADLPELAELIPVGEEAEPSGEAGTTSWGAMWPLSIFYPAPPPSATAGPSINPAVLSGDAVSSPGVESTDGTGRKVRVHTIRAWVPSKDKLSLQAMWWGYRLYLPPPVLDILSDKTLEATKRAAMITTALTWFFNNLPISSLPLAIRPTLILLQRIAPYLGYIGTFISWSWTTIKSYDVGFGVTLTATWILPIALIPGTWQEYDFPKSPEPAPAAPLPPVDQPAPAGPSEPAPTPTPTPTPPTPPSAPTDPAPPSTEPPAKPTEPPVAPDPVEPAPVPPTVDVGTPLFFKLLRSPIVKPVALPTSEEGDDAVLAAATNPASVPGGSAAGGAGDTEEKKAKAKRGIFGFASPKKNSPKA